MAKKLLGKRCCGKCEWWRQQINSGWGRCTLFGERAWCNAPVCDEYEERPNPQEYCECKADELM